MGDVTMCRYIEQDRRRFAHKSRRVAGFQTVCTFSRYLRDKSPSIPTILQVLYGVGFLLAGVYHVCHMDEAGLIASRVLGVPGPVWRTADVYMAQWLLSRMWGHALKASHPLTSGVSVLITARAA